MDATNKIGAETHREWGKVLKMTPDVERRVDALWPRIKASLADGARR
jgi:4-hydroxy-3-polyprenylbenzoate decarboxylase